MKSKKYVLFFAVAILLALSSGVTALAHDPPEFVSQYLNNPAFNSYQISSDGLSAEVFFKTDNKDHVDWNAANLTETEVGTGNFTHAGFETKGLENDSHVVHLKSLLPEGIGDNYSHNVKDNYFLIGSQWQDYLVNELSYDSSKTPWGLVSHGNSPAEIPAELSSHKAFVEAIVDEDNVTTLYFATSDKSLVDFNNTHLSSTLVPTGKSYFDSYTTTGNYNSDEYALPFANQLPDDIGSNYTKQLMLDTVTGLPTALIGDQYMDSYLNAIPYTARGYSWGLVHVDTRKNFLPGDTDPFNNGNGTASYISGWAVPAGFNNISASILNGITVGSSLTFEGKITDYNRWVSNPAHRIPTAGNTGTVYMTVTRLASNNFTWNKYVEETVPVFNLEIFSYSKKYAEEMEEHWSWKEFLQPEQKFSLENFSYSEISVETTKTEWAWSLTAAPTPEPNEPGTPNEPGEDPPGQPFETDPPKSTPNESTPEDKTDPNETTSEQEVEPNETTSEREPADTPMPGQSAPPSGPVTGDEASAFFYAILMLTSLFFLLAVSVSLRRQLLPKRKIG